MGESKKTEKKQAKNQNNKNIIFTRETLGVILVLFSTLCLICLISSDAIFSVPGKFVNAFLFGIFGYASYLLVAYGIFMGVLLITDRKTGLSVKSKIYMTSIVVFLCLIIHVITMHGDAGYSYGEYLSKAYNMGEGGIRTSSGGGVVLGAIAYVFTLVFKSTGSYVVLGAILCIFIFLFAREVIKAKDANKKTIKGSYVMSVSSDSDVLSSVQTEGERAYPIEGVEFPNMNSANQRLFVNNPNDFSVRSKRELKQEERAKNNAVRPNTAQPTVKPQSAGIYPNTYSQTFSQEMKDKLDYIRTPSPIMSNTGTLGGGTTISNPIPKNPNNSIASNIPIASINSEDLDSASRHAEDFYGRYATFEADASISVPVENERVEESPVEPQVFEVSERDIPFIEETETPPVQSIERNSVAEPIVERSAVQEPIAEGKPAETEGELRASRIRDIFKDDEVGAVAMGDEKPPVIEPIVERSTVVERSSPRIVEEKQLEKPKPKPPINRPYKKPPIDLLETQSVSTSQHEEDHDTRKEIIKRTLGEFHINVETEGHIQGPTITRYEIKMPAGIPVKRVLSYDDDLKMRLAVKDGVRIEAPIPGKDLVGIEVANQYKTTVGMREVLEGMTKKKISKNSLEFAIGKDIVGNSISDNLAKGPHYLVAGATGSGKSVCLNVMIVSLIMRYSPEELRMILIDPKMVGFKIYEKLPHLLIPEIIIDPQKALTSLSWAINEMERRYAVFAECSGLVSDIESYNENVASATVPKMPRIVIIIDELADLMETCKKDLEGRIRRLTQKARAAGIHLVLATQRPSVDIITGTIKTNLPSRIALKVMNAVDSMTILGEAGAEKLLGNGDMLYKTTAMSSYERYQGAFISNREINNIVTYIKENNEAYFDEELNDFLNKANAPRQEESGADEEGGGDTENDELFVKALALVIQQGQASISQLKRRFPIGYSKAGRLIDKMATMGYISDFEGAKPRRVLITKEEFEQKYGDIDQ